MPQNFIPSIQARIAFPGGGRGTTDVVEEALAASLHPDPSYKKTRQISTVGRELAPAATKGKAV